MIKIDRKKLKSNDTQKKNFKKIINFKLFLGFIIQTRKNKMADFS